MEISCLVRTHYVTLLAHLTAGAEKLLPSLETFWSELDDGALHPLIATWMAERENAKWIGTCDQIFYDTLFTVVFDDPCSVASANDVEAFAELAFGMEPVFRRVFKGRDDLRELIHCKGDALSSFFNQIQRHLQMAVLTANADSIVSSERSLARLYHEWDNINLVHIYGKLAFMCDPLNDVVRGALDEHWLVHVHFEIRRMLSQARTLRSWSVFVQLMLEETVADVQKRHCPTTPFDRASAIRASVSAWTLAMGLCNREIISLHVNDNAPFNLLCTWLEEIAIHIAHELIEQDDTQEDVASQQTPGSSLSQTRLIALVEPLNVNTQ